MATKLCLSLVFITLGVSSATTLSDEDSMIEQLDRELDKAAKMLEDMDTNLGLLSFQEHSRNRMLAAFSYEFTDIPTVEPTIAPTTIAPTTVTPIPTTPAPSPVPTTAFPTPAPTIDIIEFSTSITFFVPETDPNIDTNEAVAIFELICADEAVEEILVNYTKEAFEPDAGPLGNTVTSECDLENSTDTTGSTGSVPLEFVCTVEMYRRDAQQPPTGRRTAFEARDLLRELIEDKVNGSNVAEAFVGDFVAALQSNSDSDCTDNLALSVGELLNLTETITSRRLQFTSFLEAVEEGEAADSVEVDVETSSPTSAPSFVPTFKPTLTPTFIPTVTDAPTTETAAPTGQNCRYDSDCPPGQSCEGATRRFRKRKLLFGYSSGECK
mmetsp:Transcript_6347/g.7552  ORF Transcript_6347/g.7552 Transcript_6347/m.7552 type:complete len:383 (+) Transcript_6347:60-1208(+)